MYNLKKKRKRHTKFERIFNDIFEYSQLLAEFKNSKWVWKDAYTYNVLD